MVQTINHIEPLSGVSEIGAGKKDGKTKRPQGCDDLGNALGKRRRDAFEGLVQHQ
ncbi:hypothetical protein HLI03_08640 [Rhizobium laguerreae]|uniref:hypothetical protein n=1 Tax=Rhizobium laguerreae TaxID=1076926 RepID=UPI00147974A5|nr:hypothetical protein [Rhizobium laguerreae]NNH41762.1 hypothetical protein [Rhizobium laguerreae]NNH57335.1 hypothetical protein [Rhizobium laguerreae]